MCERNIYRLPLTHLQPSHVPRLGIEPATFLVCRMTPNPLSQTSQEKVAYSLKTPCHLENSGHFVKKDSSR